MCKFNPLFYFSHCRKKVEEQSIRPVESRENANYNWYASFSSKMTEFEIVNIRYKLLPKTLHTALLFLRQSISHAIVALLEQALIILPSYSNFFTMMVNLSQTIVA